MEYTYHVCNFLTGRDIANFQCRGEAGVYCKYMSTCWHSVYAVYDLTAKKYREIYYEGKMISLEQAEDIVYTIY